jgi:hypothetical protein
VHYFQHGRELGVAAIESGPQRLKPQYKGGGCGTDKSVPLSKTGGVILWGHERQLRRFWPSARMTGVGE